MTRTKPEKFPLLDHLDGLVEELRGLVAKAVSGDDPEGKASAVDAVHDARVAARRLAAGVELVEPVVPKKRRRPFAKIIRTLRRRLGELRDLDVMLGHLTKIKSGRVGTAVDWLTGILREARGQAVLRAAADLPASKVLPRLGSWWGLRAEILAARDAAPSLLAEAIHLQLAAFVEQAEKMGDPHLLRLAGKSLRYTLEMAKAQKLPLPSAVLRHFKRMQDALGLWHDDVVLAERLMAESAQRMLAHHNIELQQAVLTLAMMMTRRAQHQLARVADYWKRDGAEISRQITEAFPLTTEVVPPAPGAEPGPDLHTAPPSPVES
jgi:CHAD domain-containing protein